MTHLAQPLISVIIATYKRGDDLDRAIQSARNEPGDYFEIVVGDDGSPDHTPEIISRHDGDARLRSYRNEVNLGMQENYLKIARFARGRYLFILTDDDYLLPGALAKVKAAIEVHPEAAYLLSDLPTLDERTGQLIDLHRTYPQDTLAPAGLDSMAHIVRSAWVLSRQVLQRDAIDWATWEKFRRNIFFPIIFAGRLILQAPAYYIADRLVIHTWFNTVHWQKFGHNRVDIEFNLAADRFACMAAILHDYERTPAVEAIMNEWEINSFRSYLYAPILGYYDLVKLLGRRTADEKMRSVYPLVAPAYHIELERFWHRAPLWRAQVNARALAGRLPAAWLAPLRARWWAR